MIKHIVMWKLKEENKKENAKKIKDMLMNLEGKIKEINKIEVLININESDAAMDVCLVSQFNSLDHLNIYQNHEEHLKVGAFVKEVTIERKVTDSYE
ncbi:MAG: Dabb family protein [Clostridium sp.]|uniref:Dabb family protein n=1 Tax=Clostridium sp. TaxID=1506 RepID=UPI003F3D5478